MPELDNKLKHCPRCGRDLALDLFCFVAAINRHHNYCRECDRAHKREWYLKNKARADEARKKWQDEHHDEHLVHVKKYFTTDKGKRARERYEARKEGGVHET